MSASNGIGGGGTGAGGGGAGGGWAGDGGGSTAALPRETVLAVFRELNYYRAISHIGEARAELLFAALDRTGDYLIDEAE